MSHNHSSSVTITQKQPIIEMQLKLAQAYNHIRVIEDTNKSLLLKIEQYESSQKKYEQINQQLKFLRESQSNLKQQLVNYQEINERLMEKIETLNRISQTQFTHQTSKSFYTSIIPKDQSNSNIRLFQEKIVKKNDYCHSRSPLKSYQSRLNSMEFQQNTHQKKSYALTPKSKMSVNLQNLPIQQLNQFKKINARRRVFLDSYQ